MGRARPASCTLRASKLAVGQFHPLEGPCQTSRYDTFPLAPNYFEHDGLRLHYVDEGPKDASTSSSCFTGCPLGRTATNVVPRLVAEGTAFARLCGCGRSDKPIDASKITFAARQLHRRHQAREGRRAKADARDPLSSLGQTALPMLGGVLKRLVVLNAFAGQLFGPKGLPALHGVAGAGARLGPRHTRRRVNVADSGGPSVSAGRGRLRASRPPTTRASCATGRSRTTPRATW